MDLFFILFCGWYQNDKKWNYSKTFIDKTCSKKEVTTNFHKNSGVIYCSISIFALMNNQSSISDSTTALIFLKARLGLYAFLIVEKLFSHFLEKSIKRNRKRHMQCFIVTNFRANVFLHLYLLQIKIVCLRTVHYIVDIEFKLTWKSEMDISLTICYFSCWWEFECCQNLT